MPIIWRAKVVVAAVLISFCIKLLLVVSYHSTDFEVHRNWLAITHNTPISKWYFEDTSQWTLDYPPLFAYFEYVLSLFAPLFDADMLKIEQLNYESNKTVLFLRLTVVISELVLAFGILEYASLLYMVYLNHLKLLFRELNCVGTKSVFSFIPLLRGTDGSSDNEGGEKPSLEQKQPKRRRANIALTENNEDVAWLHKAKAVAVISLTMFNAGLFLVDHIHFQYNGMLFGILILSISQILKGRELLGASIFTSLLFFKHIFLYCAPAYFAYLFGGYCFSKSYKFRPVRFIALGAVVVTVAAFSVLPFILHDGGFIQLLSRLFPFKRGLVHAYWAPNVWALYIFFDKILSLVLAKLGFLQRISSGGFTAGLVGDDSNITSLLPNISPIVTFVLSFAVTVPFLVSLWKRPSRKRFIPSIVLCSLSSFVFGWHVHEKAILMAIIPLTLISVNNPFLQTQYYLLSTVGHISLLPLIFKTAETPVVILLVASFATLAYLILSLFNESQVKGRVALGNGISIVEKLYLVILVVLVAFVEIIHPVFLNQLPYFTVYEFLPLLILSVYSSVGIMYLYVKLFVWFLRE